jgi:OOP family OmpA-OmpF porin
LKRSILGAIALLASVPVLAQNMSMTGGRPYIGAAAGGSHLNGGCAAGVDCNDHDTAWKIYGGYTLPYETAVELTYYDLGRFTIAAPGVLTPTAGDLHASWWGLGGAWLPQFGQGWGGALRLGASYSMGKLDVSGAGSQTRNSWHPYAGIGVTYAITKDIKLEADWDWSRIGAQWVDPATGINAKSTNNIQNWMLGASFAF